MKELIEIQQELKAPKNQFNSFGKYSYRSCEDILEAVKPLLGEKECQLTLTDEIKESGGIVYVESTATIHSKDDNTSFKVKAQAGINPNKKGMDISQSFGSSSSYARKYALNGLFLIDDTKDSDTQEPPKDKPKKGKPVLTPESYGRYLTVGTKAHIQLALSSYILSEAQEKGLKDKLNKL